MSNEYAEASQEDLRRRLLWEPCDTKQELHDWCATFLGIDFPDHVVSRHSNSSPMDMIWEVYSLCRHSDPEAGAYHMLTYAARTSYKTLAAAAIEVLAVLHLERDVAHMAAIESQAQKAQNYVRQMFRRPQIRPFVIGNNKREIQVRRFVDRETGHSVTEREWQAMSRPDQERHDLVQRARLYEEDDRYIKIIVCTVAGANCVDPAGLVATTRGSIPAAEVRVGDSVTGVDTATGERTVSQVSFVGTVTKSAMEVEFEDGTAVVISEDHRVMSERGFQCARALRRSDVYGKKPSAVLEDPLLPTSAYGDLAIMHPTVVNPWSVLLGSLLGDSSLVWPKMPKTKKPYGSGPRFMCFHTASQKALIDRLHEALGMLGIDSQVFPHREGWKICSQVSSKLVPLFNDLYGGGKKEVSAEVASRLDYEAVAMWFMDDGARRKTGLHVCTQGFSSQTHTVLVEALRKIGIESEIKTGIWNEKAMQFLALNEARAARTSALLEPYVLPDLKYKMPVPEGYKVRLCVGCGSKVFDNKGVGFARCNAPSCQYLSESRDFRLRHRAFRAQFTARVRAVRFLGERQLLDIHVAAPTETSHNFFYNGKLVHNSEHTALMIVDEVDVIPNVAAFEESKSIPEGRDDQIPVTLMISTRKSATGLVQKEIDGAEQSGLMVRHWNLIDITKKCEPERHKPHLPRLPVVYRSPSLLRHVTPEVFDAMSAKDQAEFVKDTNVMAGCGGCRLYAMCQGDLINQKSESRLLRAIPKVIAAFTKGGKSLDYVHAQLMCDKPSMVGRVYPRFERLRHVISPATAYEMVFGEKPSEKIGGERLTKAALTQILAERGLPFWAGMDFGDAHPFACVFGAKDGARGFVLRALGGSHLEPDQQASLCEPIKPYRPDVYPDMSSPMNIRILHRHGYRMKKWKKAGGTVGGGIEIVQAMLSPVGSDVPELYFVTDIDEDREIDFLVEQIEGYSWEMGPDGRPTGRPVKKDDDFCDALRYGVMNVWPMKSGGLSVPADDRHATAQLAESNGRLVQNPQYNWAEETIARLTGQPYQAPENPVRPPMKVEVVRGGGAVPSYYASEDADAEAGKKRGKRGKLSWDFS